ncbi:MAG: TIGR00282 family metallophosphoesterase [Syntrophomonadaceae bacterium]|jgi:metallophosphoesterase (TIGR00282 family)
MYVLKYGLEECQINILIIADVVGKPGRRAIKNILPMIQKENNLEFIIANAENAAGGRGLTRQVMDELLGSGIDVLTMGNHVWDNKDIFNIIDDEFRLIRPINFPPYCPGQGYHIYTSGSNKKIAVINTMGRIFMQPLDCPFRIVDSLIEEIKDQVDIIIVDIHAEATSEKLALAYYFDGKVTAVLGTHTHIQTADERILPQGTAYITDLGMTGATDSILGMDKDMVIKKLVYQRPVRLEVAGGKAQLQGVILHINDVNNKVKSISRISLSTPN